MIEHNLFSFNRAAVMLRMQNDETMHQSHTNSSNSVRVPRLKMTRVHIPFTFRLIEGGNNSCDGKLQFYWSFKNNY